MASYDYQALQPREIRLLRLDAIRKPEQPLSGAIVHHKLTNPVFKAGADGRDDYLEHSLAYEALSYHWGADPRTPHELLISDSDGHRSVIKITNSLNTVLRRLALPDKERVLWADAICINQVTSTSNKEKGEQIQLMPDIYRIASCVQVYLGADDSGDLGLALEFMKNIADYSEYLNESQHSGGELGSMLAQQRGFVFPPAKDKRWAALRAFLRRPWFRRVWIIQEFVYATDITVLCGDHEIDWHIMWLFANAYVDNRQLIYAGYSPDLIGTKQRDLFRNAHEGARSMQMVTDLRMRAWGYMTPAYMVLSLNLERDKDNFSGLSIRKDLNTIKDYEKFSKHKLLSDRALGETFPFGRQNMLHLLHRTSNFCATQPIDRLYALLGLAENTEHLKPIYSDQQTLNVVTTKFAAAFVTHGRLALILATAGIRSKVPSPNDPPSWVPDWTKVVYAQDTLIGFTRLVDALTPGALDEKKKPSAEEPSAEEPSNEASAGDIVSAADNPTAEADNPQEDTSAKPLYAAALDTPQTFSIDELQGTLTVKLTSVDRVNSVLPGQLALGTPMYSKIAQALGQVYSNGQSIEEALWRTLIANRTWNGQPVPDDYQAQFENLKRHEFIMLSSATVLLGIFCLIALPLLVLAIRLIPIVTAVAVAMAMVKLPIIPSVAFIVLLPVFHWLWITALVPLLLGIFYLIAVKLYPLLFLHSLRLVGVSMVARTQGIPEDCAGYMKSFSCMANRHNLCFTEGVLMGLLPLLTEVGDVIAIVHGCPAPYVLRPTARQGYYKLIGECYLHGIMDGEFMVGQTASLEVCLC